MSLLVAVESAVIALRLIQGAAWTYLVGGLAAGVLMSAALVAFFRMLPLTWRRGRILGFAIMVAIVAGLVVRRSGGSWALFGDAIVEVVLLAAAVVVVARRFAAKR
jgi:hypothetical protein